MHLTTLQIVCHTSDKTADTVFCFLQKVDIHPCGASRIVVRKISFKARALVDLMKSIGKTWKSVPSRAPMSSGKDAWMVSTIKRATWRLVEENPPAWRKHCEQALRDYRYRPLLDGRSPFKWLYGISPQMVCEKVQQAFITTVAVLHDEAMVLDGIRATHAVEFGIKKRKKVV